LVVAHFVDIDLWLNWDEYCCLCWRKLIRKIGIGGSRSYLDVWRHRVGGMTGRMRGIHVTMWDGRQRWKGSKIGFNNTSHVPRIYIQNCRPKGILDTDVLPYFGQNIISSISQAEIFLVRFLFLTILCPAWWTEKRLSQLRAG
jgi:hypothetical protein